MIDINTIRVVGRMEGEMTPDHEIEGKTIYAGTVRVLRASGAADRLRVHAAAETAKKIDSAQGEAVCLAGRIRSHNSAPGVEPKVVMCLYAQDAETVQDEARSADNYVQLSGRLCKAPVYRTTPLGREICDIILAVNRGYGKCAYIPAIVWGKNARRAAEFACGTRVLISGRMQSRDYGKAQQDGEMVTRTTQEVSVFEIVRVGDGDD